MERAHFFFVVTAPAGTDKITFQLLTGNSEAGGERLHRNLDAWRDRFGVPLFSTGFCNDSNFRKEHLGGDGDN